MTHEDVLATPGSPRKWLVLIAVSLGLFMALLDATIVNIAVPAIMRDLHASIASVSWVLNSYNLALTVLLLSMGKIADRFGQKRVFVGGLLTFTAFSLAVGLAPSIGWLIAFRVAQAVGAAAMVPISLTILLGVFPREQHGIATGLWAALGAVAAAAGPTLGGLLTEYGSWHWIFFVNVPFGVAAVVASLVYVPERRRAGATRIDLGGLALSAVSLFSLTLALIEGNDWGWTSLRVTGLFGVAILGALAFVVWELRASAPMLDLRLFRIRSFAAANSAFLLIGVAMMGSIFLLVIFMVNVMGYSELHAAIAITPQPLTGLLLAPIAGRVVDRWGPRLPGVIGALGFSGGLLALTQLNASSGLGDIVWRTVILGVGMGFSMPGFMAAGMGSLPEEHGGVGSGAINTARQLGFVLGVAVLVAIFTSSMTTALSTATTQAKAVVAQQPGLTQPMRMQVDGALERMQQSAVQGGTAGSAALKDPLAALPAPPAGSPQAVQAATLKARVHAIYRDQIGGAFKTPFTVAAGVAFLIVIPALFTGRRLGAHLGAHEGKIAPWSV